MKAIIDTNLIYYWSGISVSNYSSTKIDKVFSEISSIEIPSWTLIEILTTSNLDVCQKEKVFEFISERGIPFNLFEENHLRFLPNNLLELFESNEVDVLIIKAQEYKLKSEVEILSRIIEIATIFLCEYFCLERDSTKIEKELVYRNLSDLLSANSDYINSQIVSIFNLFYKNSNETVLKNSIEKLVYSLFFAVSINCSLAIRGFNLSDYVTNIETNEDLKNELKQSLSIKTIHKKILKKINYKDYRAKLISDSTLYIQVNNDVENMFSTSIQIGQLKYYLDFIRKILLESAKISKNDTIDSLLLAYYPDYMIVTADTRLRGIIASINQDYWNELESLLKRIKN